MTTSTRPGVPRPGAPRRRGGGSGFGWTAFPAGWRPRRGPGPGGPGGGAPRRRGWWAVHGAFACGSVWARWPSLFGSSLDGSGGQTPDELLLEHEQQHEQGDEGQDDAGKGDVDGADLAAAQDLEPDLDGAVLVVLGDDQRPQVLVERGEEREQAEGGDRRPGQGDGDAGHEAEVS